MGSNFFVFGVYCPLRAYGTRFVPESEVLFYRQRLSRCEDDILSLIFLKWRRKLYFHKLFY